MPLVFHGKIRDLAEIVLVITNQSELQISVILFFQEIRKSYSCASSHFVVLCMTSKIMT